MDKFKTIADHLRTLGKITPPQWTKPCAHCGKEFSGSSGGKKYCSPQCGTAARNAKRERAEHVDHVHVCSGCGNSFVSKRSDANYCSVKCRVRMHREKKAQR